MYNLPNEQKLSRYPHFKVLGRSIKDCRTNIYKLDSFNSYDSKCSIEAVATDPGGEDHGNKTLNISSSKRKLKYSQSFSGIQNKKHAASDRKFSLNISSSSIFHGSYYCSGQRNGFDEDTNPYFTLKPTFSKKSIVSHSTSL